MYMIKVFNFFASAKVVFILEILFCEALASVWCKTKCAKMYGWFFMIRVKRVWRLFTHFKSVVAAPKALLQTKDSREVKCCFSISNNLEVKEFLPRIFVNFEIEPKKNLRIYQDYTFLVSSQNRKNDKQLFVIICYKFIYFQALG